MKIILDARKVEDYGIGEYIKSLFSEIIASGYFDVKIIANENSDITNFLRGETIYAKSKNYSLREHFEIPRLLNKYRDFFYF